MVTTMALQESLSKFVDKVNDNVSRLKERQYIQSSHEKETDGRPTSPFFLLLSEGGEEFDLNHHHHDDDDDTDTPTPSHNIFTTRTSLHQVTAPTVLEALTMSVERTTRPTTSSLTLTNTPLHTTPLLKPTPSHRPNKITTLRTDIGSVCNNIGTPSLPYCTIFSNESSNVTALDTMDGCSHSSHLKAEESPISKSPPQLLTKQEFDRLFDHSGRLVNEHELRRTIFKNGIHDDVRKQVWQFLFELYPFNTTAREREILKVEQTVRYEAMKIRWKKLLKTLVNDYEGVAYCPKWFTGCTKQKNMPKASQLHNSDEDGVESVIEEVKESCCSGQAETIEQKRLEPPSKLLDGVSDNNRTDTVAGEPADELHSFEIKDSGDYGCPSENPDTILQPDHINADEHLSSSLSGTPSSFCPLSSDPNDDSNSTSKCFLLSPIIEQTCSITKDATISDDDQLGSKPSACDQTLRREEGDSSISTRLSSGNNICIEDDIGSPCSNIENLPERRNSTTNSHCEDTCDCKQLNDSLTVTGERLEKLPPWIVQMINASTLPSHKCKKKKRVKSKDKANTCDDFIRAMDEDITKRRELLGIVENANRYVNEQKNIVNTTNTTTIHTSSPLPLLDKQNQELETTVELEPSPPTTDNTPSSSLFGCEHKDFEVVVQRRGDDVQGVDCPYCSESEVAKITLTSSVVGEDQVKFMQVEAQIYAARQSYDPNKISESVRVIDKDVPRTDRELDTFSGNDNIHLVELRDALLTYAFFNPDVGYAQGMNDIMARFLVVMKKESEAYWMFVRYMDHFKHHFMEEGMLEKISLVEQLLLKMDKDLHDYLHTTDMGLMFCHRWLLLNFKREFEYHESLRIFEITSSRHLEVSSLQAELERSKQRAEEFVQGSAGSHLEEVYISPEIPFDIFICVAMLMECRDVLMATSDLSRIYEILSNLPHTLDLENILEKSEQLFYQYCRRTVVDCFQVIDDVV